MIHKSFPVDEEVWLTRDGVAKGEDDVVKRALEWINNLSYAHSVTLNKTYFEAGVDTTLFISATVENPNQHPISITAALADSNNVMLDSVYLYDDGMHQDGEAGDKIWANFWTWTNESEQTVHVDVITDDPVGSELRNLSNAVQFTSIGPLVFGGDSIVSKDQEVNPGERLNFRFKVKNSGITTTAPDVMSHVFPLDTCASISTIMDYKYGDIAAGTSVEGIKSAQQIIFNPNCGDCAARFAMEIFSKNWHFWNDTFSIFIHGPTGIPENEPDINGFALDQNYPNPFGSITTISYLLPEQRHVVLKVYDIQGREVATLVNEVEPTGNRSVMLNAESWPSGIYYYRMHAGDFIQTRKLILLR
jgi:hypothetical protein